MLWMPVAVVCGSSGSGGVAALNHRLTAGIPPGCDTACECFDACFSGMRQPDCGNRIIAKPKACQALAGGQRSATTGYGHCPSSLHPGGMPEDQSLIQPFRIVFNARMLQ